MLLAVFPFGLITGVAMVASGIPPAMAVLMSVTVFAGASMIASAQLLASGTPLVMVLAATAFINLRFMMYSATLRPHFARAPLGWRLLVGYLVADNVVGLSAGRFADHPDDRSTLELFLGVGALIWTRRRARLGDHGDPRQRPAAAAGDSLCGPHRHCRRIGV
ncbi:MAG: AzlC family ABC transporter permease [Betaproteobacteria bacterium]